MTQKCPNCGHGISANLWARVMDQSRLALELTPTPGEHMSARAVGGCITSMDRLLKAVGRDLGVKTVPLVERIETTEGGGLKVHLLVTNVRDEQL